VFVVYFAIQSVYHILYHEMIGCLIMNKEVGRMQAVSGDCPVQGNPGPAKKD
jgi:hypothetical protein